ncbi:VOC family protein [Pseudomonadota bacterium]
MKINGFNSVQVIVADLEKSRHFFEDFLMLENTGSNPACYHFGEIGPDIYLKEIPDAVADPNQPGYHFRHIGFEVERLEQLIDRSVNFGFDCFQMNHDGTTIPVPNSKSDLSKMPEEVIFIRDFDNNLWEFVEKDRSLPMLFER